MIGLFINPVPGPKLHLLFSASWQIVRVRSRNKTQGHGHHHVSMLLHEAKGGCDNASSGIFPEGKTGKMGYPQKKFGYTCVPSDNQLKLLTDHLVLVLPSLKHI